MKKITLFNFLLFISVNLNIQKVSSQEVEMVLPDHGYKQALNNKNQIKYLSIRNKSLLEDFSLTTNEHSIIIGLNNNKSLKTAYLYDLQGQEVYKTRENSFNKDKIQAGMYIIRLLTNENNEYLRRIIIE